MQTSPGPEDPDGTVTVTVTGTAGKISGATFLLTIVTIGPPDSLDQAITQAVATGDRTAITELLGQLDASLVTQIEAKIAKGLTSKLLLQTAINPTAQASRGILSKLTYNTADKFVRVARTDLIARFRPQAKLIDNLVGTGKNPVVTGLGPKTVPGYAVRAAQAALRGLQNGKVKIPRGLTKEAAEAYLERARRVIAEGKDAVGTQAARALLLDYVLNSGLL